MVGQAVLQTLVPFSYSQSQMMMERGRESSIWGADLSPLA